MSSNGRTKQPRPISLVWSYFIAHLALTIIRLNQPNGDFGAYQHDLLKINRVTYRKDFPTGHVVTLFTDPGTTGDQAYIQLGQDVIDAIIAAHTANQDHEMSPDHEFIVGAEYTS